MVHIHNLSILYKYVFLLEHTGGYSIIVNMIDNIFSAKYCKKIEIRKSLIHRTHISKNTCMY